MSADDPFPMTALTTDEMREADRRAIEDFGIPGVVLMENAGAGAADVALEMLEDAESKRVLILAGRGNNGGDGYVIARHLHNAGVPTKTRVLSEFDTIAGDARTNLDVIRKMGLDVREIVLPDHTESLLAEMLEAGLIVDAMLGTGTKGSIREPFTAAIALVMGSDRPVLAVDIPSGMNGDTGEHLGTCVVALRTATFAAYKIGMLNPAAKKYTGEITVVDIGMPREILAER